MSDKNLHYVCVQCGEKRLEVGAYQRRFLAIGSINLNALIWIIKLKDRAFHQYICF